MPLIPALLLAARLEEKARVKAINDRLSTLAHERGVFEESAPGIASRFNGEANEVYYPLGSSTERFTISYSVEGQSWIGFAKRTGGRVNTAWSFDLVRMAEAKVPPPRRGTLNRLLWRNGLRIATRRLNRWQRARLNAEIELACYGEMPLMNNLNASFVRKDGSTGAPDRYDPSPLYLKLGFLPITREESAALGLGDRRWAGVGDFKITCPGN